jgi:hypothetical protein
MNDLEGKHVLMISPGKEFFDYHLSIIKNIEKLGGHVTFFPERQKGLFFRLARNLGTSIFNKYNEFYLNKILNKTKNIKFDYFLLIRGEIITPDFLQKQKKNNPTAKLIMYQWDSIKNNNYLKLIKYFDEVYSFDPLDCSRYQVIKYLPLFYTNEYSQLKKSNDLDIDILLIAQFNENRYTLSKEIKKICDKYRLKFYYYLYIPFWVYLKKLFSKHIFYSKVKIFPLSKDKILNLYSRSKVILDISSLNQSGLTIRTFEALGAGKKLITTNKNIYNEPFYDHRVIKILDHNNFKIDNDFINNAYKTNIDNYSIDNWVKKIFKC